MSGCYNSSCSNLNSPCGEVEDEAVVLTAYPQLALNLTHATKRPRVDFISLVIVKVPPTASYRNTS